MIQSSSRSPFADPHPYHSTNQSNRSSPSSSPETTRPYPARKDSMRDALKDIVVITPNDPHSQDLFGSDPYGDIISSYGADSSEMDLPATSTGAARNGSKGRDYSPEDTRRGVGSGRKEREKKGSGGGGGEKKKPEISLDVIDRLDISGLYGGGGLTRHDGPFAAATAARNKGPRAPMAAFDPSALAPPSTPSLSTRSPRTAASTGGVDGLGGLRSNDGPYGAVGRGGNGLNQSQQSVHMGFPSDRAKGKGQQLIEIYGVRDNEAWQDFGTERYEPVSAASSFIDSKTDVRVSKEDRVERAQSIWDIEATIREGKPIGRAPPPVPLLPSEFSSPSSSTPNNNSPKRSKSLAARFRAGLKNPNNPILDEVDYESPTEEVGNGSGGKEEVATHTHQLGYGGREANHRTRSADEIRPAYGYGSHLKAGGEEEQEEELATRKDSRGPPVSPSARFAGGVGMEHSRSEGGGAEGGLGRRPSVMQRMFGKKKATS